MNRREILAAAPLLLFLPNPDLFERLREKRVDRLKREIKHKQERVEQLTKHQSFVCRELKARLQYKPRIIVYQVGPNCWFKFYDPTLVKENIVTFTEDGLCPVQNIYQDKRCPDFGVGGSLEDLNVEVIERELKYKISIGKCRKWEFGDVFEEPMW